MAVKLEKLNILNQLLESDYLSMTQGLDKIFLKSNKKSKMHLALNDKKSTEEEMEEYKAGRLYNWTSFMKKSKK